MEQRLRAYYNKYYTPRYHSPPIIQQLVLPARLEQPLSHPYSLTELLIIIIIVLTPEEYNESPNEITQIHPSAIHYNSTSKIIHNLEFDYYKISLNISANDLSNPTLISMANELHANLQHYQTGQHMTTNFLYNITQVQTLLFYLREL